MPISKSTACSAASCCALDRRDDQTTPRESKSSSRLETHSARSGIERRTAATPAPSSSERKLRRRMDQSFAHPGDYMDQVPRIRRLHLPDAVVVSLSFPAVVAASYVASRLATGASRAKRPDVDASLIQYFWCSRVGPETPDGAWPRLLRLSASVAGAKSGRRISPATGSLVSEMLGQSDRGDRAAGDDDDAKS